MKMADYTYEVNFMHDTLSLYCASWAWLPLVVPGFKTDDKGLALRLESFFWWVVQLRFMSLV